MDEMVGEAHTRFLCRDCGELFYDETAFNQHFVVQVRVFQEKNQCLSRAEMHEHGMRITPSGMWWAAPNGGIIERATETEGAA
jgi:hypothetical protein